MNSNSFMRVQVRVQKQYFFEFNFEFGKMIEFVRVNFEFAALIPTIMAPKRTLCVSFGGLSATIKKLRTSSSDATNRWFDIYIKNAQFDIYKPQVIFLP